MAVGKVNGVAVGDEVFVLTVTLYGKACVQYVVNGGGVVAFVVGSQCSTIVIGRIGGGSSGISQVALHVGQGGRCSGVAGCILHAGNHVAGGYLVTCAVRCVIEVAVGVFVYLRAIGFGVYHRGLGILHHGLGIQSVGVALVTITIQILFHGQPITGFQCQGATGFGSSGSRSTYYVAAGVDIEAAVVDGVGNVAGRRQFVGITSRRGIDFAVGYCQRRGVGRYFVGGAAVRILRTVNTDAVTRGNLGGGRSLCSFELVFSSSTTAGYAGRIPSFVGQSGYGTGIAVNCHWITAGSGAYGDAVSQLKANLVVFYSGNNVAVTGVFNGFGQFNGIRRAVIGGNLEAVFFQVMQLAAVDGFFAAGSNVAVRYTSNFVAAIIQTILS